MSHRIQFFPISPIAVVVAEGISPQIDTVGGGEFICGTCPARLRASVDNGCFELLEHAVQHAREAEMILEAERDQIRSVQRVKYASTEDGCAGQVGASGVKPIRDLHESPLTPGTLSGLNKVPR